MTRNKKYNPITVDYKGLTLYIFAPNPHYAATQDGQVYSKKVNKDWTLLKTTYDKQTGYNMLCLTYEESKQVTMTVARFVYQCINGEIKDKKHVDHIDSNKTNDNISNLQLLTCQENLKKGYKDRARKEAVEIIFKLKLEEFKEMQAIKAIQAI